MLSLTFQTYKHDSQKAGKGSFAYAWVLDETPEERERYINTNLFIEELQWILLRHNLKQKITL